MTLRVGVSKSRTDDATRNNGCISGRLGGGVGLKAVSLRGSRSGRDALSF